jgi:hypothetical protein
MGKVVTMVNGTSSPWCVRLEHGHAPRRIEGIRGLVRGAWCRTTRSGAVRWLVCKGDLHWITWPAVASVHRCLRTPVMPANRLQQLQQWRPHRPTHRPTMIQSRICCSHHPGPWVCPKGAGSLLVGVVVVGSGCGFWLWGVAWALSCVPEGGRHVRLYICWFWGHREAWGAWMGGAAGLVARQHLCQNPQLAAAPTWPAITAAAGHACR